MRKYNLTTKNSAGFSVAGVLVAAATLGILSIAMVKTVESGQKGYESVKHSTEFNILRGNLQKIVDSPTLCATAFRKDATTPLKFIDALDKYQDVGMIRVGTGAAAPVMAQVGMDVGPGMTLTKLQLQQLVAPDLSIPTKKIFHAALFVEVTKKQQGFGGSVMSNKSSPILVTLSTNSSNQIEDCSSTHVMPTCTAGQTLEAMVGGGYKCVSLAKIPTACGAGQSLEAVAGGGFVCVNKSNQHPNPNNGYWTSFWDGRHGTQHTLAQGQYVCGLALKQNCDGASSEDACFSMKICTP